MAKIGIMSFAHLHANSYAACLNELPEAEFVAIWDTNRRRGQEAAAQFGTRFIGGLEKFLASDIQGVIVTSENAKHKEMVKAAANAGKWILCEKPLAPTVKDAKTIIATCKRKKVGLGTAFPCRYTPSLMDVRERVRAGEIGALRAAACTNNGQYPGGWFSKPELSGGGATIDHTVHVADALRWITGEEFTKVYCELGDRMRRLGTDDVGSVHLEMEGGLKVSHIASWSRCDSFPTWGDVTMQLVGDKGVIEIDAFNQKLDVYNDDDKQAAWAYWGGNPDLALVQDFVAAVDDRREPTVTGEDGLRAVEVTEAAYKSAESGRFVRL
jgi:predicted dehydrogenase